MDKQIEWWQLDNPDSGIVKVITYIYQMNTFVCHNANLGSWQKDESKIDTLGAYSHCLAEIIRGKASQNRKDEEAKDFKKYLFKEANEKD